MALDSIKLASGVEVLKYEPDTVNAGRVLVEGSANLESKTLDNANIVDKTTAQTIAGAKTLAGALNYALAATADNLAYTLTTPITALVNGAMVSFKMPAAANTGAATLNVNSLGAKKMVKGSDNLTQCGAGDLAANGTYWAVYNTSLDTGSGAWVVLNAGVVPNTGDSVIAGGKTFSGTINYGLLATADNIAYTSAVAIASLANGAILIFKMPAANSGASATLNVNSLGAKKMLRASDQSTQITTGDLIANGVYLAIYDSSLDTGSGAWVVVDTPVATNFLDTNNAQTVTGVKTLDTNTKLQLRDSGVFLQSQADGKATFSADGTGNDDLTMAGSLIVNECVNFAVSAGTSPAYTLAVPLPALAVGAMVMFYAHASSTDDAATLNVNSLGAKPLCKNSDLSQITDANVIKQKGCYQAIYSNDAIAGGAWMVVGV